MKIKYFNIFFIISVSFSILLLSCKPDDKTSDKPVNDTLKVQSEIKDRLNKNETISDSLKLTSKDSLLNLKSDATQITEKKKPEDKIIVYYFHPTVRCSTCINIENYTKEAVDSKFPKEKKEGLLRFKELNIEQDENEHYVSKYDLTSSSVILVHYRNGKQIKWKNLEQVWAFEKNKEQFLSYIKIELKQFLKNINKEG